MSEWMFDPEKVHDVSPHVFNDNNKTYRAVPRLDYDKLLELYRNLIEWNHMKFNNTAAQVNQPHTFASVLKEAEGPQEKGTILVTVTPGSSS